MKSTLELVAEYKNPAVVSRLQTEFDLNEEGAGLLFEDTKENGDKYNIFHKYVS